MIGNVWYSAVKVRFNGAAADMLVYCCFFGLLSLSGKKTGCLGLGLHRGCFGKKKQRKDRRSGASSL